MRVVSAPRLIDTSMESNSRRSREKCLIHYCRGSTDNHGNHEVGLIIRAGNLLLPEWLGTVLYYCYLTSVQQRCTRIPYCINSEDHVQLCKVFLMSNNASRTGGVMSRCRMKVLCQSTSCQPPRQKTQNMVIHESWARKADWPKCHFDLTGPRAGRPRRCEQYKVQVKCGSTSWFAGDMLTDQHVKVVWRHLQFCHTRYIFVRGWRLPYTVVVVGCHVPY